MNIFALDNDPRLAAQYQCDKHVVKMVLESAQLMSTCHRVLTPDCPKLLYRKTHVNHPCAVWLRASLDNYHWMCGHAIGLCQEYTHRYGRVHRSQKVLEWCVAHYPEIESIGLTDFALAMPEECRVGGPVDSYRNYYKTVKRNTIQMVWSARKEPDWWMD